MALPVFAPLAADPIDIDAGATYKYVIACTGETALSFVPNSAFNISLSGRTLSITLNSDAPASQTVYQIIVRATNADGVVAQAINFRAGVRTIASSATTFSVICNSATTDFQFADGVASVAVGDAVGLLGGSFDAKYYVIAVDTGAGIFQISTTIGGSAETFSGFLNGTRSLYVFLSSQGTAKLNIRDTSLLTIGDVIRIKTSNPGSWNFVSQFTPTEPTSLESSFSGDLYVKDIIDQWHITVSATAGGSAIQATQDTVCQIVEITDPYTREFPAITSTGETDVAQGDAVSYTITSDLDVDSFSVSGLPSGLSFSGSSITGTAPASDVTAAVLITASFNGNVSKRYWQIVIGAGSNLTGGSTPGVSTDPPDTTAGPIKLGSAALDALIMEDGATLATDTEGLQTATVKYICPNDTLAQSLTPARGTAFSGYLIPNDFKVDSSQIEYTKGRAARLVVTYKRPNPDTAASRKIAVDSTLRYIVLNSAFGTTYSPPLHIAMQEPVVNVIYKTATEPTLPTDSHSAPGTASTTGFPTVPAVITFPIAVGGTVTDAALAFVHPQWERTGFKWEPSSDAGVFSVVESWRRPYLTIFGDDFT